MSRAWWILLGSGGHVGVCDAAGGSAGGAGRVARRVAAGGDGCVRHRSDGRLGVDERLGVRAPVARRKRWGRDSLRGAFGVDRAMLAPARGVFCPAPMCHGNCSASRGCSRVESGGGGIRTRDILTDIPVFKTGAFSRSATPPVCRNLALEPQEGHRQGLRTEERLYAAFVLVRRKALTCAERRAITPRFAPRSGWGISGIGRSNPCVNALSFLEVPGLSIRMICLQLSIRWLRVRVPSASLLNSLLGKGLFIALIRDLGVCLGECVQSASRMRTH